MEGGIRENGFIELFGSKNFDFVKNSVQEHVVIYDNMKRTFKIDFIQIDRIKFEQWLAEPILHNIHLNTRCTDIKIKKDYAPENASAGIQSHTDLTIWVSRQVQKIADLTPFASAGKGYCKIKIAINKDMLILAFAI